MLHSQRRRSGTGKLLHGSITNLPYSSCDVCCHDLVEDRKYVVDDDLLVHHASAMSVAKHWCRRDMASVVEMDIAMGKREVVKLRIVKLC